MNRAQKVDRRYGVGMDVLTSRYAGSTSETRKRTTSFIEYVACIVIGILFAVVLSWGIPV